MRQLTFWHSTTSAQAFATANEIEEVVIPAVPAEAGAPCRTMDDLPGAAHWISAMLEQPVQLTITRNRSTMVSYRCTSHGVRLRLHRIFLQATQPELQALVEFVLGDRNAAKVLDRFVQSHAHRVGPASVGPVRMQGAVHDLQSIFAEVNDTYFHSACKASITWAPPSKPRGKGSLRLGLYQHDQQLISLHPCLDQEFVPRYYVAFVVFHEMLHELFGVGRPGRGRRSVHPVEMRVVQSCHPDYAACKAWEAAHVERLLAFRPTPRKDRGRLAMRGSISA